MPGEKLFENARILFRNFAGEERQYNQAGARNFCLLLGPEAAEDMAREGWNVKTLRAREEGMPDQPYVKVAVGSGVRPPTVVMITSKGRTTLPEDLYVLLDYADIENVDLIIRPYEWVVNRNAGIKAYLKCIYVTIREDALQRKYADVPEIGSNEQMAIGAGPNQSYDYEGEIVEEDPTYVKILDEEEMQPRRR